MSIQVKCACGKLLKVRDEAAGKKIKCPGCQAVIEVPEPRIDLMPEEPAEPAGPPPDAPAPQARTPYRGAKEFDKSPAFPLMVLSMFFRPHYVLEYFRGWAARPAVLVQIVLLYVGSLAAISTVAAAGYLGPSRAKPAEPERGLAAGVDEKRAFARNLPNIRGVEARMTPEYPQAGDSVTVRICVFDHGNPVAVNITGTMAHQAGREWELGDENPKKAPPPPAGQPIRYDRDEKTGWSRTAFIPKEAGTYAFTFQGDPPLEGQPFSFGVWVREREKEPEAPKPVVRAITATTRIMFAVLASLIAIAINAFAINMASKVFGEGGDFLFLMVVLAFVQSIVNLGQLALLAVGPSLAVESAWLLTIPFGVWEFVLVLLAIMKVYEFDLGAALLTSAVASIIKMWGAALIVGSIMGL